MNRAFALGPASCTSRAVNHQPLRGQCSPVGTEDSGVPVEEVLRRFKGRLLVQLFLRLEPPVLGFRAKFGSEGRCLTFPGDLMVNSGLVFSRTFSLGPHASSSTSLNRGLTFCAAIIWSLLVPAATMGQTNAWSLTTKSITTGWSLISRA